MANVASIKHGLQNGAAYGARAAYDMHSSRPDENQSLGQQPAVASHPRTTNQWRSPQPATPSARKEWHNPANTNPSRPVNGNTTHDSDDEIPENMYRPDKDHPEGWIHRDKLAKIESEELQAAGINLANARTRSQSRIKSVKSNASSDADSRRDEKRQRLQSPAEIEDEVDRASWDLRLPEEIEAERESAASQIYSNPVLRKSGSKIPIMTSSPAPIPSERYERDTLIARKRTASGTMSFEGDLNFGKTRNQDSSRDDSDTMSSAMASSKQGSPQKSRSTSATLSSPPGLVAKKTTPATRKVSAPSRATPSPSQRTGTRSGEQDRPRTAINAPEGDPPWLATMYKPDPMLPPDQQLIPTLAKKQMQAQWAAEGAVPKAYDREFTPIDVHNEEDLVRRLPPPRTRTPSPVKDDIVQDPQLTGPNTIGLQPVNSVRSNRSRPASSGSFTAGYSTMPKVTSPPMREQSPRLGPGPIPGPKSGPTGRPSNQPPPTRMQAQNLEEDEDQKKKKGCGCCVVM